MPGPLVLTFQMREKRQEVSHSPPFSPPPPWMAGRHGTAQPAPSPSARPPPLSHPASALLFRALHRRNRWGSPAFYDFVTNPRRIGVRTPSAKGGRLALAAALLADAGPAPLTARRQPHRPVPAAARCPGPQPRRSRPERCSPPRSGRARTCPAARAAAAALSGRRRRRWPRAVLPVGARAARPTATNGPSAVKGRGRVAAPGGSWQPWGRCVPSGKAGGSGEAFRTSPRGSGGRSAT